MWEWVWCKKLWKDSTIVAFAILGIVSSVFTVVGVSIGDILAYGFNTTIDDIGWATRFFYFVASYAVLLLTTVIQKTLNLKNGITLKIRGIQVNINQGDIFSTLNWKVIPLTESFDVHVDDVVIARNSLHGKFIERLNANELNEVIKLIEIDYQKFEDKRSKPGKRCKRPLGHVIPYNGYMMLAFTRFDDNQAHLSYSDYIKCLLEMWKSISRHYAHKPIVLPLLGSGITRFDDRHEISKTELLECMLSTLKTSSENINQPITILLTEEVIKEINLYKLKGV